MAIPTSIVPGMKACDQSVQYFLQGLHVVRLEGSQHDRLMALRGGQKRPDDFAAPARFIYEGLAAVVRAGAALQEPGRLHAQQQFGERRLLGNHLLCQLADGQAVAFRVDFFHRAVSRY